MTTYAEDYYLYEGGVGDFHGDGKANVSLQTEYCADEYCFAYTEVWLSNGDGTLSVTWRGYVGYGSPVAGDFNSDGKLDLAASGGDVVWTALGNGAGGFLPGVSSPGYAYTMALGDFNRDHRLDIAGLSGTADILLGKGDGTFQTQRMFVVGGCPIAVVAADFNGDGKPDVATANQCSNDVTVLTNTTQ